MAVVFLAGWDVDIGDRVSGLLLEHRFGLPCDTCVGALASETMCLTMVDMGGIVLPSATLVL